MPSHAGAITWTNKFQNTHGLKYSLFFLLKEELELVLEHFVADSLFLEVVKYLTTSLSWNSWTALNKHPILFPDLAFLLWSNHPKMSNQ